MKRLLVILPAVLLVAAGFSSQAQLTNFQVLHSFGTASRMGATPRAGLIFGSDGYLYGTTVLSGEGGQGTVFKVHPSGANYSVLHHFNIDANHDAAPEAALLEGSDGVLYGTTSEGGARSGGTVFKLNKDGTGFAVLYSFIQSSVIQDGFRPMAALIEASDGKLYGTTSRRYAGGEGTVFRLNKDGSGYQVVHFFNPLGTEGAYSYGALVEGQDGALYGTASEAGSVDLSVFYGTVFKVNKDGSGFGVIRRFQRGRLEPNYVQPGLIEGKDGLLYGMSVYGGVSDLGTAFKIQKDGQNLAVLHSFGGKPDGGYAFEELIEGQDGALYGTASEGGQNGYGTGYNGWGTVFKIIKDGSGFRVLHHFENNPDGWGPRCKLVQAPSGELFGITAAGGQLASGTIFALDTNGSNYRIVWHFSKTGTDAQQPYAGLVEGPDEALYGAGYTDGLTGYSGGDIFKINKDGSGHTILRHFSLAGEPAALGGGIIVGSDGRLYGTSEAGGNPGVGTVYVLNRDGTGFQVLHHFALDADAHGPYSGVVEASDGFLYGTTRRPGVGAIYKISKSGTGYVILRYLKQTLDGGEPEAALIEGSDGWLYGTTPVFGLYGRGTVFKISKDGTGFIVLRHFTTAAGEPNAARSSLFEASDGVLYGTSYSGGLEGGGTVFKMNKDGTGYAVLYHFPWIDGDARQPLAALVEGRDGALYGTTQYNGLKYKGTVFKIQKGGSGFLVLHEFTGKDGAQSTAVLLAASDGAFYGTAPSGGDLGFGTIFRIGHLLGLRKEGEAVALELSGVPGYTCTIERSVDLQSWSVLQTATLPSSGQLEFTDAPAPLRAAFYRAKSLRSPQR